MLKMWALLVVCVTAASWINTENAAVARTIFEAEVLMDSSLCRQTPAVVQHRQSGQLEAGLQLLHG